MSTSLLDDLNELIDDESAQLEYKHELAASAFTNDVARLMADQGISQADLARKLGVSRARVSQLMQHASSPTLRTMVEVATALGCDLVPGLAPCGFRPARLYVADGSKNVAGYRQTKQISDALRGRVAQAERIAV
ncbi:MAG: helix-turn-helix transcriptional regulator [Coriobacteriia bacterium]